MVIKRWAWAVSWYLYLALVMPQLFMLGCYGALLMRGPERWVLAQTLLATGWSMSLVGAPFFLILQACCLTMMRRKVRGVLIFLVALLGSAVMLVLWNYKVYATFTLGMTWWPLLLCLSSSVGIALALRLFRTHLGGAVQAETTNAAPVQAVVATSEEVQDAAQG